MSEWAERIYRLAPRFAQNALLSAEGARIVRSRYGKDFKGLLEAYESRSHLERDSLDEFVNARLRATLRRAVAECDFYRREPYLQASVDPTFGVRDLSALPILTKDTVRENVDRIVADDSRSGCATVHTSGTTGAGLVFPSTQRGLSEQWAVWWRYRRWHGIDLGEWSAHFGGRNISADRSPHWRLDRGQKRILFSAYHTNETDLAELVEVLRARRPRWLHCYPSFISLVANHLLSTGETLGYEPKWITTGAENLLESQASCIERAFGVAPIQHYGLAEAVVNASQCELGRMHVDEDFGTLEIVNDQVIGTGFANDAFPLVRYATNDTGTLDRLPCACGRSTMILGSLDGRSEDYIELADGSRLGRLDHIFKDAVNVVEAQFRQQLAGRVTLLLVVSPRFVEQDLDELRRQLGDRTQGRLDVDAVICGSIPKTSSGKHRLVVRDPPT